MKATIALAGIVLAACGGGMGEPECPTDDCSIPGSTVVKWRFHEYPQWSFIADTCLDLEVATVHAEAVNVADPALYFAVDAACGEGQATFLRLPEGTYDVVITPLDAAGEPMVHAGARGQVAAGVPNAPTETVVNVEHTAWTRAYTGTFLFELAWAGMDCEPALVATQTLKLMIDGQTTDKMADNGQRLDGIDEKPCRPNAGIGAQFVEGLPFGPATLVVTGRDALGAMKYERAFETFIGVGKNNPTLLFDVPPPDPM